MSKTLPEKMAAIRAARAAVDAAVTDLLNPATGEALRPSESAIDEVDETSYANAAGAIVQSRVRLIVRAEAPPA